MTGSNGSDERECGCPDNRTEEEAARPDGGQGSGYFVRRAVRALETPSVNPRTQLHRAVEPLSEMVLHRPGMVPVRALVPASEATAEAIRGLEEGFKDLPRLPLKRGRGAVDIKLESRDGEHVKQGAIILEGPNGKIAVPLDATTRTFRLSDIAPGEYVVRGAASSAGRGSLRLGVRDGDVTRAAVRLDGRLVEGKTTVKLAVRGTKAARLRVSAKDKKTGETVLNRAVAVEHGILTITDVPFGNLHFQVEDDEDARSCYDADVNGNWGLLELPDLVLIPERLFPPEPPEELFGGLSREFEGIARVLPEIGIRSLEQLAAAEPEDLMHRTKERAFKGITPIHSRLFGEAVEMARANLGLSKVGGERPTTFRIGAGETFSRSWLPRSAGEVEIAVDLGPGKEGELLIDGEGTAERHRVVGAQRVRMRVTPEAIASRKSYTLSLVNVSGEAIKGVVHPSLSVGGRVYLPGWTLPTIKERIEQIYQDLAVQNPGLGTVQPDSVMVPENIKMWVDRARTIMSAAGVCSLNDLGRFRLTPNQILRTGTYIAPAAPAPPHALTNYKFSQALSDTVLYYVPNDILHTTAVVLAGEWDIRGQSVIIGREVRELVVIARSIRHDGASRISWEMPTLPVANSYWPNPADNGPNGTAAGQAGADAQDGDPTPPPMKNGGANASLPAPTLTMYVFDTTNNIPPIDLRGQNGGTGGRGQNGGRGGNGQVGLRANGTLFGGCCRGVGFGGNGGQGGDGGRGGKGGTGGQGGRVTLLTSEASIVALSAAPPMIDVNGGAGGGGGLAGDPGPGGTGGPAGTADCETWCDEHPERRGSDGATGNSGVGGLQGDAGPMPLVDAMQILPLTEEDWQREFNQPHILDLIPDEVEPGQAVQIVGQNFDPGGDRIYYDGVRMEGVVSSSTQASFTVPLTAEGGYHPVVVRPDGAEGATRRSNRALLRVLPKLDEIPAGTRWTEEQDVTLTGLAFGTGLQVLAEDRSVVPKASFLLPVNSVTRTSISLKIPAAPLGSLRGVRRIVVRNPDGGESRDERVSRIGDTIVVRCAAFRVVGATSGVGTVRDAATITSLFTEGSPISIAAPWGQARIAFRLVQPVQNVTVPDDQANLWPDDNFGATGDRNLLTNAPGVAGALNFFFVRDVEVSTAYAYFGGGPLFIGDEGSSILGPVDFQQVVAHEVGHALCLRHVCSGGEGPGTFFNRACEGGDSAFLMYPFWDTSDGMTILPGQVDPARLSATHFEDGKTAGLAAAALFQTNNTGPQCGAMDAQN